MACEWTFHALAGACAWHAAVNGNLQLLLSSWICGTLNDTIFMALPVLSADNFWQSSCAALNLTPRMPFYITHVYLVFLYASAAAARRLRLPYASEAAFAGLAAHLLYAPYDVNGPRYLWWFWHDSDPAIRARMANAPVASSIWVLTFSAAHTALSRFVDDAGLSLARDVVRPALALVGDALAPVPSPLARAATSLASLVDRHALARLVRLPALAKVAVCGLLCPPLFVSVMSALQLASLDVLGVPAHRTYCATIAAYAALLARAAALRHSAAPPLDARAALSDRVLYRALAAHYVVHLAVAALGDASAHVVTGCRQRVGRVGDAPARDLTAHEREETVVAPPEGGTPALYSKFDFAFVARDEDGALDANGERVVAPDPADELARDWYTVRGVPRPPRMGGRAAEVAAIAAFAAGGLSLFRVAW